MTALLFAGVIGWLYAATLVGLFREWIGSADASYGAILAVVSLGLVWQRRAVFTRATTGDARGLALLTVGASLYVAGSLGADLFLTRVSLVVVLAAAIVVASGTRALRVLAAPLAFFLLAIPLPAIVVNAVTLPLQLVASRLAEGLIAAAGTPVLREGNLLQLPGGTLEVAAACSGLRSLISLLALSLLLAWTMRAPTWRRLLVTAAAVPIAIVANAVRIAATGLVAELWTRRVLSGGWHELTGWITFVAALALLACTARVERKTTVPPEDGRAARARAFTGAPA